METPQDRAETKELEASSLRTSKTPKEGRGGPGATIFLEEAIGWQRGGRELMMWPLGGVRWGKKRGKPAARPPPFGLEHCAAGDASRVEKRGVRLGCSAQPSRTPSPAQLLAAAAQFSIWPAPDSSARPHAPRAHIHRARPGLGRSRAGPGDRGAARRADGGTGRQGQGGGGRLGAGQAGSGRAGRRGLAGRRHVTGPL